MTVSPAFRDYVLEMLEPLGGVSARAMFGGAGLYLEGTIFGLIADEILYFKVDDTNRADYAVAGSDPFMPYKDKPFTMPYWEVPADVMEESAQRCDWALKAWQASRRSGTAKPKRGKSRS